MVFHFWDYDYEYEFSRPYIDIDYIFNMKKVQL